MAITRFEDLPSTNTPINATNLNGNFDELGVKVGTSIDSNYKTNILYSTNLFDKNTITNNYYYDASGNYTALNGVCVSDYIEVQPNKVYKLESADIGTYTRRINFFNSSKQWLNQEAKPRTDFKIVIPNNCKYVRISGNNNLLNNTFIFKTNPIMVVDNEEGYNTNEMYSNSEIVVGTWINGKPLYRKVITGTGATVTSQGTAVTKYVNIASNIEIAMIKEGYFNYNSVLFPLFFTNSSDTSKYCRAYIGKSTTNNPYQLVLQSNATSYSELPFVAVIEYTKTTD